LDNALDGYKLQIEDGSISSAEAASQAIKIASESFPNSQFAKDIPNPKVKTKIAELKKDGATDTTIKAQLTEAGIDPKLYGID
jgi:lipase chaperone LimK